MKVKIIRSTVASGFRVEAGKTYDLCDYDASTLIRMGKAKQAVESETPRKKKEVSK